MEPDDSLENSNLQRERKKENDENDKNKDFCCFDFADVTLLFYLFYNPIRNVFKSLKNSCGACCGELFDDDDWFLIFDFCIWL